MSPVQIYDLTVLIIDRRDAATARNTPKVPLHLTFEETNYLIDLLKQHS